MKKILIISFFIFIISFILFNTTYATNHISDSTQNFLNQNKVDTKTIKEVLIIPPSKINYDVGEKLDTTGLSITVVYTDGTIEQIEKDYTITGFNRYKEAKQTLTISYKGYTRTYDVKVGYVPIANDEKLPQTGDFFDLKDGLYLIIVIFSITLLFIVYKNEK